MRWRWATGLSGTWGGPAWGARAVALSLVFPSDDPRVEDELRRLRHRLAPDTAIVVGGPAVPAYERALREIGAVRAQNMSVLAAELERLR